MWLLIAFIAVPLIEIALFIQVGGAIGLWSTLGIVIITALIGTYLVRQQGMAAISDLKSQINGMQDPTEALAHGAMILFSGALLLTPGFFTDALGFAMLVPAIRTSVIQAARKRIRAQSFTQSGPHPAQTHGTVIDGDYKEVSPEPEVEPRRTSGTSGWTNPDQKD